MHLRPANKYVLAAFIDTTSEMGSSDSFMSWESFSWTVINAANELIRQKQEPYVLQRRSVHDAMACSKLCDYIWYGYLGREGALDAKDSSQLIRV